MLKLLFSFLAALVCTAATFGQSTGKIVYKELGLEFKIPNGWVGQESEGGFVMGHETIPGMIMLMLHDQQYSKEQLQQEAQEGIDFGPGSYLSPTGTLTSLNDNSIAGEFKGTIDYQPVHAYLVGKTNPYGFGVTIMTVTTTEQYDNNRYPTLTKEVANSVLFSKVPLSAGNDAGSWKKELSNTKLTYMDSYYSGGANDFGGGYSSKTVIDLCAAGYFIYYENSSVSVSSDHSGAYSHGSTDGNGQWSIQEKSGASYLILQFHDSSKLEFKLEWGENKKLLLDGTRYYRTWTDDQAPDCQ